MKQYYIQFFVQIQVSDAYIMLLSALAFLLR